MSNFFGFHGERPSDRGGGGAAPGGKSGARRKRIGGNSATLPNPMIPNPMMKPNQNSMTYNGMYNVATVAPPPINQRPARRSTRSSQSASSQQSMMFPNGGVQHAILPPQPVNAPVQPRNVAVPLLAPAPGSSTAMSDLQAKVAQWKQKRLQQRQQPVLFEQAQPEVQPHPDVDGDDDGPEDSHPYEAAGSQRPVPMDTDSMGSTAAPGRNPLDRYKTEVNRTVDSVREEVSTLRRDIALLADTVKATNSSNPTDKLRMVEQQVQKVVMDQNRAMDVVEQVQLIGKSHQEQLDQLAAAHTQTNFPTHQELDEILDGFSDDIKKRMDELQARMDALQEEVKSALQSVSDRSHWMYGLVLQDQVSLFESHELNSRVRFTAEKGTRLLLCYPMKKTREGVWLKARLVSEDGQMNVSWVPIWTYTSEVLAKFGDAFPPADQERVIHIGGFTLH